MLIFIVLVSGLGIVSLNHTDGKFVYALDDGYIHMAVAKNLIKFHVWGVFGDEFTSLSSSLLWTVLIYLSYLIFGINELSPFILNLLAAFATIFVAGFILGKFKISGLPKFLILASVVVLAPLPGITLSGLEHTAHIMLTIAYIFMAAKALSYSSSGTINTYDDYRRYRVLLYCLAPLLTSARYEGLFLLGMVSLLFLIRRKYPAAIINGAIGLVPVSVFGFYAMAKGWFFLPNSVLIKGNMPDYRSLVSLIRYPATFIVHLILYPHLLLMLVAVLIILYRRLSREGDLWDELNVLLLLLASIILLHAQFASSGWLYRYEAYLVAAGIMIIGIAVINGGLSWFEAVSPNYRIFRFIVIAAAIFVAASPFLKRGYDSLQETPVAVSNIYEQQYQTGIFLQKYYSAQPVAINDVGTVNFLADFKCIDLMGLGNREIGRARIGLHYDVGLIEKICEENDLSLAVVNENVFDKAHIGGLPKSWIAVGQWYVPVKIMNADDHFTFYAPDSVKAMRLLDNLREFSRNLPPGVRQAGLYMENLKNDANQQ